MTDFDAALDEAIRSTGVERYRHLCSDANTLPSPNSRDDWRRFIVEGRWRRDQSYPSLAAQAGNALGAAGRVVATAVQGEALAVDLAEEGRRLAICLVCEHFDAAQGRCRVCGCVARWKARLASEHCPLPEPKW